MIDEVGFEFPVDLADQWSGFNDPGMEHFSGNPYVHVGKEVPQNTIDALRLDPAELSFNLVEVAVDSIPGVTELRQTMQRCLEESESESPKAKGFFEEAVHLLGRTRIHTLLVSDANTTGITGPSVNGQPYHAFMKATGQSKKGNETGLGSFGIGKFAPFTVSKLRTVFVSTVWESESGQTHYVQGKSILMSHKESGGTTRQAVGYWGIRDRCQPVTGPNERIPHWLDRDGLGTTLAILGFDPIAGWDKLLAASVAQNFFGAISDGRLTAKVGEILLNATTLAEFLARADVMELVKDNQKDPEAFREAGMFLSALTEEDGLHIEHTENLHLGNCELRIRTAEGLPKRVAILRDGMFITAELSQLKRFADFKDFVAVVRCKSEKGNKLLRSMEPPRHDDFEPQRLLNPEEQRRGRVALREIGTWVRDMLKRYARDEVSEETIIDELAAYFADDISPSESKGPREGEVDPRGKIIVRARPLKRSPTRPRGGNEVAGPTEAGGESGEGLNPVGGDGDASLEPGAGGQAGGVDRGGGAIAVALSDVRAVPLSDLVRRVSFTTDFEGQLTLRLQVSGADSNQPLSIASATGGRVAHGEVRDLSVQRGVRNTIDVTLLRPFAGAVRISADAV